MDALRFAPGAMLHRYFVEVVNHAGDHIHIELYAASKQEVRKHIEESEFPSKIVAIRELPI